MLFLFPGKGGVGKSTVLKHLALTWAEDDAESLKKFRFVFYISLKNCNPDSDLETLIVEQHAVLKMNAVKPDELRSVLKETNQGNTLLLVDDFDVYQDGKYTSTIAAIQKDTFPNAYIVVGTRETEKVKHLRTYVDAEVELLGIDKSGVPNYLKNSLKGHERVNKVLKQAKEWALSKMPRKVYGDDDDGDDDDSDVESNDESDDESDDETKGKLDSDVLSVMTTPLLLNMLVTSLIQEKGIPKTKMELVEILINWYLEREAIRASGKTATATTKQAVNKLGKQAWEAFGNSKLTIAKVRTGNSEFKQLKY